MASGADGDRQKPVVLEKEKFVIDIGMKALKFGFYGLIILATVIAIIVVLSVTYTDDPNPVKFFFSTDNQFSFSGQPMMAGVDINSPQTFNCDMVNNGTISFNGESLIYPEPIGDIYIVYKNGFRQNLSGDVVISAGKDTEFSLLVQLPPFSQDTYNNTHLSLDNGTITFERRGGNYNAYVYSPQGVFKTYDNQFIAVPGSQPVYSFMNFLHVSKGSFLINESGRSYSFDGEIIFPGSVAIGSVGEMMTLLPINDTESIIGAKSVKIFNTDGSLVIGKKEYPLRGADNIIATTPMETLGMFIKNGKVIVAGKSDSVTFRNKEYAQNPYLIFLQEGYFTIFTGLCTGALALAGRQMLSSIKK